jgi:2-polyprenyl-6-methoxyphenol hydroxylase-like FAD-dependent oxidoreductase
VNPHVTILGAGLSGALMSIFLARNARKVVLYERRPDLRKVDMDAGRSINLALAARGIEALKEAGVFEEVEPLLIPMRGRILHAPRRAAELRALRAAPARGDLLRCRGPVSTGCFSITRCACTA